MCVCLAFLFRILLLSPRVLERLQTFSAVAKSCLLSIDVFFLPLEIGKSLWCAEKYVSKCYIQIVQALGYLKVSNDGASQDIYKICGNLRYSLLFASYGMQCKDTYQSFSSSHFSADKTGSVFKLLQDRNKFACN